jgi:acetyl-CoA synthetase
MSQIHKHDIPANIAERCLINPEQYHEKYQQSVTALTPSGASRAYP